MTKPLLLLDIDGVFSPFGAGPPPGYQRTPLGDYEVVWNPQHVEWLAELAPLFDFVWATTWEHDANEALSPILGLPQLPVIEFDRGTGDTWKLPSVREYVGDRAMAWIDDDLYLDAFKWANTRSEPTLLLKTQASIGLTDSHLDKLIRFSRGQQLANEQRVLDQMSNTIQHFIAGTIAIPQIVTSLETTVVKLGITTDQWIGAFWDAWTDLEMPYAAALDQAAPIPDATDPVVRVGLLTLKELFSAHATEISFRRTSLLYPCPCCGYLVFGETAGSYEICPICFWEDDIVQLRWPDWAGGANRPSLIDSQRSYKSLGAMEERFIDKVRQPNPGDVRDDGWRPIDVQLDNFEPRGEKLALWPDNSRALYWWRSTYWRSL